jgi:hypothetical protein
MKRIIYLALVLTAFLLSCEENPVANFSTNTIDPVVGQEVFFYNSSSHAERVEWDFGDGYISNEGNPVHIYNATGTFEVTLTVTSKNGLEDKASIILNVIIPTLLEIEVREYYDEYTVSGASVILYPTISDWDAQTNMVIEGFTDDDGIVVFSNLDPFVYYVDVWEATHDNYTLRDEDVGFIRTPEVIPNKITRFIAWVDYVDHGKGIARGSRQMVIKKLERVVTAKKQPPVYSVIDNWKELYDKSIKKK